MQGGNGRPAALTVLGAKLWAEALGQRWTLSAPLAHRIEAEEFQFTSRPSTFSSFAFP